MVDGDGSCSRTRGDVDGNRIRVVERGSGRCDGDSSRCVINQSVEPELLSTGVAVGVSSAGAGPVMLSTGVAAGKVLTGAWPVLLLTVVVSTGAGPTMLSTEASGT